MRWRTARIKEETHDKMRLLAALRKVKLGVLLDELVSEALDKQVAQDTVTSLCETTVSDISPV